MGQTPSVADADDASEAKRFPARSAKETLEIWIPGAESVSGRSRSTKETVNQVPEEAYDATEYPDTAAVTPETFPFRVSENVTYTASIFPSESESLVVLERIFGETPSDTEETPKEASGFPERSATELQEYEYA